MKIHLFAPKAVIQLNNFRMRVEYWDVKTNI